MREVVAIFGFHLYAPMRIKLFSFLVLFFFARQSAYADTFIVTSNADSGPGTLREAITLANGNGGAVSDNIIFNIAGTTQSERTIVLQSQLPALSSKITIDGSTQTGSSFGISQSKIILYLDHYTSLPFSYLFVQNATEVTILGICFGYFENPDNGGSENYAIQTKNSSNIIIGLPGKGNLFSGVRMSITNNPSNGNNDAVSDIKIQSNVFGQNIFSQNNGRGTINLINSANIFVGGNLPEEGNIFISASIVVTETPDATFSFFIKINNNRFASNWDGTIYYNDGGIIELSGNITDNISSLKTEIKNNLISRGNISLNQMYHTVLVQGNKIGTDITGLNCIDVVNIGTGNCKQAIIGGHLAEEENVVNGNIYSQRHGTHIIKNIISGYYGSGNEPNPTVDPFIKILAYNNNLITGTANPNAKIQLYTINCNTPCRSKTYAATVFANNSGNWSFPYTSADPNFVATATAADSSTSEFSKVRYDHFTNRVIKHATCGKSNGSITGITVFQGTHMGWYNSNTMQLISTDTNLVNVPAGGYVFLVSNGANGCPIGSNFVIEDLQPPPSLFSLNIVNPSCGINNGIISSGNSSFGSKWMNNNMDSIGTGNFINQLFAGTYYLKLWIPYDTSCNKVYGPFTLTNQSGPSLDLSNIQITESTCTNSNGSISGISASNVTGIPVIEWLDQSNNIVGNTFNLQNVPAGKYKLRFKDQSTCGAIVTPEYSINAIGSITIDSAGKLIKPAGCSANTGSIQNIRIINATSLSWENVATNVTAGSTADILNLGAGTYRLTASNTTACSATIDVIVPQAAFTPVTITTVESENALCGQNSGFIKMNFAVNPSQYSFKWVNSSNQVIGNGFSINNLGAGVYVTMATDANGCEGEILRTTLQAFPIPTFDYSQMKITDDVCTLKKGGIAGIRLNGVSVSAVYKWLNINNDTVSSSLNLQNISQGKYKLLVSDGTTCRAESSLLTVSNTSQFINPPLYDNLIVARNSSANLILKNL